MMLFALLSVLLLSPPVEAKSPAQQAIQSLRMVQPALRVTWRGGHPAVITGLDVAIDAPNPVHAAQQFLSLNKLTISNLSHIDTQVRRGRTQVRFAQQHDGLLVLDRTVNVTIDAESRIRSVLNEAIPLTQVRPATITAEAARELALRHVFGHVPEVEIVSHVRPVIIANGILGVSGFEVGLTRALGAEHIVVRIDAHAGHVLGTSSGVIR